VSVRPTSVALCTVPELAELVGAMIQGHAGDVAMSGVSLRAGDIHPGDLFAALPGARAHGADFAAEALAKGAVAVLTDAAGATRAAVAPVPVLVHPDPRSVLGAVSAHLYGDPSAHLPVLGITGTSGRRGCGRQARWQG